MDAANIRLRLKRDRSDQNPTQQDILPHVRCAVAGCHVCRRVGRISDAIVRRRGRRPAERGLLSAARRPSRSRCDARPGPRCGASRRRCSPAADASAVFQHDDHLVTRRHRIDLTPRDVCRAQNVHDAQSGIRDPQARQPEGHGADPDCESGCRQRRQHDVPPTSERRVAEQHDADHDDRGEHHGRRGRAQGHRRGRALCRIPRTGHAPSWIPAPGIAASSSFVYSSRGFSNTSSVVDASTILPLRMTHTLSATSRTTARSCVMKR
jgi:hypothetical protein